MCTCVYLYVRMNVCVFERACVCVHVCTCMYLCSLCLFTFGISNHLCLCVLF